MDKFFNVTLPMLSPYIFFNLVMGIIGTLQIFTQAFIMTQGGPVNSTLFYVYFLFNSAFRYLKMGYSSSEAWVLFLIVFLLTLSPAALFQALGALRRRLKRPRRAFYVQGPSHARACSNGKRDLRYLLLLGAVVFCWLLLWMVFTSVKLDRELFARKDAPVAGDAGGPGAVALCGRALLP